MSTDLEVVDELFCVDVETLALTLGRDDGETDVHRTVDLAACQVSRTLPVDQDTLVQYKVPLRTGNAMVNSQVQTDKTSFI